MLAGLLFGCGGSGTVGEGNDSSGAVSDGSRIERSPLDGFDITPINGSQSEWAIKKNHQGIVMEQGPLLRGVKDGTWTTYHLEKQIPSYVISYVQGQKTGPYMEFNDKGEMKVYADYFRDKLHGKRIEFGSIGRFLKEARYKNDIFHGLYSEWSTAGKLQKTMNFVDGELDGPMAYYNKEGKKTIQYEYKNGKKISGGVLPKEAEMKEEK